MDALEEIIGPSPTRPTPTQSVPPMLDPRCPTTTLWGHAQHRDPVATGLVFVTTGSHGGMWVCPELLARIPKAVTFKTFRRQGELGWFEEDCDWAIPYTIFRARIRAAAMGTSCGAVDAHDAISLPAAKAIINHHFEDLAQIIEEAAKQEDAAFAATQA